jgi:hypothetical protein
LFIDQGVLLVACVQQIEHELEDELRLRFNVPVRAVLAAPMAINQAIAKYYAPGARDERAAQAAEKESTTKAGGKSADKPKKAAAATKPKKRRGPKTPEEVKNDQMIGIVVVNFSFVVAYLLDAFILTPGALFDPWWLYVVVPGITALVVWQTFWKK